MEANPRVLAIAVASNRLAYVILDQDQPVVLGYSRAAARTPDDAAAFAANLLAQCCVDIIVTEDVASAHRKGKAARARIAAIADVARLAPVDDRRVVRRQAFANKYHEAEALADAYPSLKPCLPPRRRFYDSEPKAIIYFEALSMALQALNTPLEPDPPDGQASMSKLRGWGTL